MISHKSSSTPPADDNSRVFSQSKHDKGPLLNFDRFAQQPNFESDVSDPDNVDAISQNQAHASSFDATPPTGDMQTADGDSEYDLQNEPNERVSMASATDEWANDQDELLYQQSSTVNKGSKSSIDHNAPSDNDASADKLSAISTEDSRSPSLYEMIRQNDDGEDDGYPDTLRSIADNTARWNPSHVAGPSIPTLHAATAQDKGKGKMPGSLDAWLHAKQEKSAKWRTDSHSARARAGGAALNLRRQENPAAQEVPTLSDDDDDDDDDLEALMSDANSDAVRSLLKQFERQDLEAHEGADEEMMLGELRSRFRFEPGVDFEQAITRVAQRICSIKPYMHWRTLRVLDLSSQNLSTMLALEDIVPKLEVLDVSNNALSDIPRLPASLQTLKAKTNRLVTTGSFQHLNNLQYLDICNNAVSVFEGMSHLHHLRTIHAENNKIASCNPFRNMRGLIHLNLRGNFIKHFAFRKTRMECLETLDASYNRIESLDSIEGLVNLRVLMLDHNDIKWIELDSPMAKIKVLRMCFNRLRAFDGSNFPDLRTLYMDDNQMVRIIGLSCIPRLASFSMRDQGGQRVELNMKYLRAARKLYLSGNALKHVSDIVDFFALQYLELCAVQMEEMPAEFARHVPNLGALYLSHNYLKDIRALRKLRHLRKLVLIDNRIHSLSDTLDTVKTLNRLQHLDLRQNPITAKLYPPVKTRDTSSIASYLVNEHDPTWISRDVSFVDNLPAHWNERRQSYRALCIKCQPRLTMLDGLRVTEDEAQGADDVCAALTSKCSTNSN